MIETRNPFAPAGVGDMFLAVKGARSGPIKGESQDDVHKGEIEVLSWSWGMQAKPSLGGGTATGKPSVTWQQVVDESLCFGWIDGIRKSIDADSFKQRVTPRRAWPTK